MRKKINRRIYDTEKSDCMNFSIVKDEKGESTFRAIFQKRNNKELFYFYKNQNKSFVIPLKEENLTAYNHYLELQNT
jgi:hypothetical protein